MGRVLNNRGMEKRGAAYRLDSVGEGTYVVVTLGGGAGFLRKLADLGIYTGSRVKVIRSTKGYGPLILSVKGSRFALGRGVAARILVRPA
jgi:ferrous iron transport protein A